MPNGRFYPERRIGEFRADFDHVGEIPMVSGRMVLREIGKEQFCHHGGFSLWYWFEGLLTDNALRTANVKRFSTSSPPILTKPFGVTIVAASLTSFPWHRELRSKTKTSPTANGFRLLHRKEAGNLPEPISAPRNPKARRTYSHAVPTSFQGRVRPRRRMSGGGVLPFGRERFFRPRLL